MSGVVEFAKEHPVTTVAIVGVGVLVLFALFSGGGGGQAAQAGGVDPNAAMQLQAQAQAQSSAQGYQLAATQLGGQIQLALAHEQDLAQIHISDTAAGVANNQNSYIFQASMAGIAAQLEGLKSNNATSVGLAEIAANENTTIAGLNAQVAVNDSNNNRIIQVTNSNNWANVQETISNNALTGQLAGGLFGLIGAIF